MNIKLYIVHGRDDVYYKNKATLDSEYVKKRRYGSALN